MTDSSCHEAWTPKPHHHTVHNDQHSSYMCEHCSRLTPPSPPVKVYIQTLSTWSKKPMHHLCHCRTFDHCHASSCAGCSARHTPHCLLLPSIATWCLQDSWDRFVEANWAPTLRSAFGTHWKHTVGSEVPAMLQLSQHPGRQLTDMKSSTSWSKHDPNATSSHSAGRPQSSPAFSSVLTPQCASLIPNSAPMNSQPDQLGTSSNRTGTMNEWADIFDQCKTAVGGSDPSQGVLGQQEDPRAFASFMPGPGGAYTGPPNVVFQTAKSLNSEDAEDCMFGDSDDEGAEPSSNGGAQRLPYFGGIADWPVKQIPHLSVS